MLNSVSGIRVVQACDIYIYIYIYIYIVFANGQGDLGSIPGHVIPKTFKIVLNTSLLNTQQYKVRIKGKVEESKEKSSALPTPQLFKRELSGCPRLLSPTLLLYAHTHTHTHIYIVRQQSFI